MPLAGGVVSGTLESLRIIHAWMRTDRSGDQSQLSRLTERAALSVDAEGLVHHGVQRLGFEG